MPEVNKHKTTEQKFLELIRDSFMAGVSEKKKKIEALKNEIVADDGVFTSHFSITERLRLVKVVERME